ncbi:M23 family metallopeptidase [Mucilaginibacter sp. dw_454]|uniref:M23 family metallopeptidase n=1 Tax=Mucilaginibacter sp. dw_454 TaxID=2720079 RepID=UPI001BD6134A|nr:M23 family metallopeptidase [Mucilaginibacter sp. dw_454]
MNKYCYPLLFLLSFQFVYAQKPIQSRDYPQDYFRYPLDLPPAAAGGFAELRPMHFHAGIDFRTNQRTGYPVHAAADGYISRVRVQFGGGGNIVYINHPNGYTTVYMHNLTFAPEIAKAVHDYQYQNQLFEVDFNLQPNQITVHKGDVIAISGQSGAVAGPHSHFEIRETKTEETVNPQLFGITIPDHIPPTITAVGVYSMGNRPFSEYTPHQFMAVAGAMGNYHLIRPQVIEVSGNTAFGISTTDMNNASSNRNGAYSIQLNIDGKTVYTFAAERFAFDQTHAINGYIDYPSFLREHRFMQKCFVPPGSHISLYPQSINRGIVNFNDDQVHDVQYVVKDVAGNTSTINLKVHSKPAPPVAAAKPPSNLFYYDRVNVFTTSRLKVIVDPGNLYDNVEFTYDSLAKKPGAYSITHRIHNKLTPIHDRYDIWIKPDLPLGDLAGKAVITGSGGLCDSCIYENGYVKGKARSFGDFYVTVDVTPPYVIPLNIHNGATMAKAHGIFFRIGDNLTGVKTYNGKIDGKWVLMAWDYKTKVLSYTFDDSVSRGKHNFELVVGDAKNNFTQYTAQFTR